MVPASWRRVSSPFATTSAPRNGAEVSSWGTETERATAKASAQAPRTRKFEFKPVDNPRRYQKPTAARKRPGTYEHQVRR